MKPKNKRFYLLVGFFGVALVIFAVVITMMKKDKIVPNNDDPLINQTDNEDIVEVDPNSDKEDFISSLISVDEIVLSEHDKFAMIDFDDRVFSPIYDPAISLIADSGLDFSKKVSAPYSCIVTPDSNQIRTFNFQFNQNISASKYVWQVSFYPFSGVETSLATESSNLLQSGELPKTATSLTIDFSKVFKAEKAFFHPQQSRFSIDVSKNLKFLSSEKTVTDALDNFTMIPLRTYYVRVFPVDSLGNSIGDAGVGLPVLYGDIKPAGSTRNRLPMLATKFSLLLAKHSGTVTHNGEFPNNFVDKDETTIFNTDSKTYSVLPSGYPTNTQELLIQVSLINFTQNDWSNTPGLVYEKRLSTDHPDFKDLKNINSTFGIILDFSTFVPSDNNLPNDKYIRYYVRAIALSDGVQPATASATYSETVVIDYGKNQAQGFKFYPEIKISPEVPTVEKLSFTPVHWEAPGWQYHYVVTRQPTEKEVFVVWGSNNLYSGFPIGTKIDFTPKPENKSWWEEAWDAISDFFSDLVDFTAKLVNWVSKAYADLKSGVINIAVSTLPESWQGPMRKALTAMVDYGLASIGIPPSLPNFDQLASMGKDYLATLAMEQAGIPADSIIEYGVEELAEEVSNNLTKSAKSASPNPMNWNFVKLDDDYLYRPAYIMIELYNPYNEATPSGKLSLIVDKFMDMSKNGFDPTITRLYALYGSSYICLFKPVYGMEIPSLAPGQHLTIPIILEPYLGIPLPGTSSPVSSEGFHHMYGLGEYNFSVNISYELPPISESAKKQGYTEEAIYSYTSNGSSFSFTIDPSNNYNK
ncbi:MAG: hypothetical protein VB009_03735 [Erysipelotrichaceae bacterium]|nr:hypothetical protein [Erysipelotrichaceae bacterium]